MKPARPTPSRRCPLSTASSRRGTKLYRIRFAQEILKRLPTVWVPARGSSTAESVAIALLVICLLVPFTAEARSSPPVHVRSTHRQQLRRKPHYRPGGAVTGSHSSSVRSDAIVVTVRRRRQATSLSRRWIPILTPRLSNSLVHAAEAPLYQKNRPSRSPKLNFLDGCRANPPPLKDRYAAFSLSQRRSTAI